VKVYTIGIGSEGEAPFVVDSPVWGKRVVYQRVSLDEDTLRGVADATGGMYFHAAGLEGLRQVYDAVDRLEKTEVETQTFEQYDELYARALLPALGLLLAAALGAATRYLEVP
jgi:Ca-activated chloride channel family protein